MNNVNQPHIRFWLITLCLFALFSATLLGILNLEGIIAGNWAAILSVCCTVLSVLFAFLQWQMPFSRAIGLPNPASVSALVQTASLNEASSLGVSKRRGALIVKARKNDCGATIHLCLGFTSTPLVTEIAANITEYEAKRGSVFVALFPALEPGNYTVFLPTSPLYALITICTGQIAYVDWRTQAIKQLGKGGNNGLLLH